MNGTGRMTVRDLWNDGEVSLRCKGRVEGLVSVFDESHLDKEVWDVRRRGEGWNMEVTWLQFGEYAHCMSRLY